MLMKIHQIINVLSLFFVRYFDVQSSFQRNSMIRNSIIKSITHNYEQLKRYLKKNKKKREYKLFVTKIKLLNTTSFRKNKFNSIVVIEKNENVFNRFSITTTTITMMTTKNFVINSFLNVRVFDELSNLKSKIYRFTMSKILKNFNREFETSCEF